MPYIIYLVTSNDVLEQSGIYQIFQFIKFTPSNIHQTIVMKENQKSRVFPFESPQAADFSNILLLDVTHSHLLQEVSGLLKQKYLVPYQNNSNTATGILFGAHARPIISLPVQPLGKNAEPISVHFLVDTAAPTSFISKQALLAIFDVPELALIESPGVNIWGVKLAVNPSTAHWQGINILGANYLRKAQLAFKCIYDQDPELEYCKLEKKH